MKTLTREKTGNFAGAPQNTAALLFCFSGNYYKITVKTKEENSCGNRLCSASGEGKKMQKITF